MHVERGWCLLTEAAFDYELRADGIRYILPTGIKVRIKGNSARRVSVSLQSENTIVPPETGNLEASKFREALVDKARKRLGDVNGLADHLGLIAVGYDSHLAERQDAAAEHDEQTNEPALVGSPYRIANNGFVRLKNTNGGEIPQQLTNFTALVEEETVKDDGADTRRYYRIKGEAGKYILPAADVPAAQFGSMRWVAEKWGLKARITAGPSTTDFVREAIELRSQDAPTRHIFQHTGFRALSNGRRVYLHGSGAVGADGIAVELEGELNRYALPDPVEVMRLREAVRWSLRILDVAPDRVAFPLLGAVYLAPLSEIVVPDFVLWLWAATGNLKSTLASVALSHFGNFSEDTLPISFESTPNFMERVLFLLKDTLTVVDDWRPSISRADAAEMDKRAQRLLRGVGNRQGRGRMNSDITLRHSYPPRGMVIATAESLPEGPAFESATARTMAINVSREHINLEALSQLQTNKAELAIAMRGYVETVAEHYDNLESELEEMRRDYRDLFAADLAGGHPRAPGAAATLMVGLHTLKRYAVSIKAISSSEGDELVSRAKAAIRESAKAHAEATKGEDPATRFIDMLRSLFAGSRVYVKDRETGTHPDDWAELGWARYEAQESEDIAPERNASFVGWADEQHLYLDKDASYAAVAGFAQRGGIPFGIKPRTLWRSLAKAGLSLTAPNRVDSRPRIEGSKKWVIQLRRDVLGAVDDD
jgi:hypothetical protein